MKAASINLILINQGRSMIRANLPENTLYTILSGQIDLIIKGYGFKKRKNKWDL